MQALARISIKRPVFATVMSLMIVLVGVISFQRLTVREYPKIDTPVVSVRTVYKGASPQVMESQITQPLEDSLSGIEGVDVMSSSSRSEVSNITIIFKLSRDPRFLQKLTDVVGLYLNPPDKAIVLCVDEKSQIQALQRTQPGLPLKKGAPAP